MIFSGEQGSNSAIQIAVVQLLSHVRLFATPWIAAHQASLSFTVSQSLFKLMFMESLMPSNHLILCHPRFILPSIFSSIKIFSNESALCIKWPRYCSFSFSICPSNDYSGFISLLVWSPCCPRDSQESSSGPQLKSIKLKSKCFQSFVNKFQFSRKFT